MKNNQGYFNYTELVFLCLMPAHTGDKLLDSKSYFNSGLQQ